MATVTRTYLTCASITVIMVNARNIMEAIQYFILVKAAKKQQATTKVHQNCVLVRTIHYDIMTTPQISKATKCTSGGTSAYCLLQTEYKLL